MSDCKSLKKRRKRREKEKKKKGAKEKKEEKEENLKGKREKIIMCLFSEERSYIQEALLVSFVGL